MKGKASKQKLQRRISEYCAMVKRIGEDKCGGYKMPGSCKRT